ncbi:uncharacterized protein LOC123313374 [Coccinella septempunctata]|uniref:uncharacterized protein LOC123313374 n=1 Tax=Coccinella septempunctata TaxID=41139 RepID=UPI001D06C03A|nr:uncharacterized protein LOC123313374 [Coccinella septempunctata]
MPNPMKKYFRRPAVRRCRKVASKKMPERNYYEGSYRDRGGLSEWLGKQHDPGLQPKPYMGGSHSQQMQMVRSKGKPHGGYFPCGSRPAVDSSAFEPATSMSNVSECLTDDSRYSAKGGPCYPPPQPPCKPAPERLPAGGTGGSETSAHRELMFMIDQLEQAELEKIQRDLRQFQTSRRRLMFNLSSLSATSSPPARLMQPVATATAGSAPGCIPIMPAP